MFKYQNPIANTIFCQIVFGFRLYLGTTSKVWGKSFSESLTKITESLCYLHEKTCGFVFGLYLQIMVGFGFGFASRRHLNSTNPNAPVISVELSTSGTGWPCSCQSEECQTL